MKFNPVRRGRLPKTDKGIESYLNRVYDVYETKIKEKTSYRGSGGLSKEGFRNQILAQRQLLRNQDKSINEVIQDWMHRPIYAEKGELKQIKFETDVRNEKNFKLDKGVVKSLRKLYGQTGRGRIPSNLDTLNIDWDSVEEGTWTYIGPDDQEYEGTTYTFRKDNSTVVVKIGYHLFNVETL